MVTNEDQFLKVLREVSPELYYIKQSMLERGVFPSEVLEIVHKIGLVKQMDDGYGKIIAETKPIEDKEGNIVRRV
jgi:predicted HAD superfamily Cof-like phosphohydrolase